MPDSIRQLLGQASTQLRTSQTPNLDAEVLLQHCLNKDRAWLMAHNELHPDAMARDRFWALVQRRQRGEPVAHLTGYREFWSLRLKVNSHVLIPRPETETLVEQALLHIPKDIPTMVLDLGTGSGAVALAIASDRPHSPVTATDNSDAALRVAAANARALSLNNVTFRRGDWFEAVAKQQFDVIVSNPPYVADTDPHLTSGDLPFEPARALRAGPQGLRELIRIINDAPRHLQPGGWLLLEHGPTQAHAIGIATAAQGFTSIETIQDLKEHPRVTMGSMGLDTKV